MSTQFEAFKMINDYPWLCYPLGFEECASDYYDWDTMKIRPVTSEIVFNAGFFPGMPSSHFLLDYPKLLLGASEVIVDLYISSPENC